MPLYELFCLTRPAIGRQALTQIIKTAGQTVLAKGGVLTDVSYFGEQQLAYEIRNPGGKFGKVRGNLLKGGCTTPNRSFAACSALHAAVADAAFFLLLQADMWQLQFKSAPGVLGNVEHNLKVDERVLRYIVQKQPAMPTVPNTHNVRKWAQRLQAQPSPPAAAAT